MAILSLVPKKNLTVKKFGGTSLQSPKHIANVAHLLATAWKAGERFVVVVSAMAGTTNSLVSFCQDIQHQVSSLPYCSRQDLSSYKEQCYEKDVVLTAGEQINAGLLALGLQSMGLQAQSLLSWQLPIITNDHPTNAEIQHIATEKIEELLGKGVIPIVAGFQGITKDHRLTTLGRGGSDTTAVAISAFLKAKTCDIYTDVRGIYTADPSWVANAQQLRDISYEDMLFLAQGGAKVMHPHGVYWAKSHGIDIRILSTFQPQDPGTLIHHTDYKAWGVSKKTLVHWTLNHLQKKDLEKCLLVLKNFWTIDLSKKKDIHRSHDQWSLSFCTHGEDQEAIALCLEHPFVQQPIHFITVLSPWNDSAMLSSPHPSCFHHTSHYSQLETKSKKIKQQISSLEGDNLVAEKEQFGVLFGQPVRYFPLNHGQGFGFFAKPEESHFLVKTLHSHLAKREEKQQKCL